MRTLSVLLYVTAGSTFIYPRIVMLPATICDELRRCDFIKISLFSSGSNSLCLSVCILHHPLLLLRLWTGRSHISASFLCLQGQVLGWLLPLYIRIRVLLFHSWQKRLFQSFCRWRQRNLKFRIKCGNVVKAIEHNGKHLSAYVPRVLRF